MPLKTPSWWYGPPSLRHGLLGAVLTPIGWCFDYATQFRFARSQPYRAGLPVVCVGNLTAGGTGKTPISMAIARLAIDLGYNPAFLTRGHGGRLSGPLLVTSSQSADEVGDEPILLSAVASTVVAKDRAAGAQFIEKLPGAHDLIIMDDGLQNPTLTKDLSLAVIDHRRLLGNGRVIPAGPLRGTLTFQLRLVDVVLMNVGVLRNATDIPSVETPKLPTQQVSDFGVCGYVSAPLADGVAQDGLIAFAGIGDPQRFFSMLERDGHRLIEQHAFADHAPLLDAQAQALLSAADRSRAALVTTAKDFARLSQHRESHRRLAARCHVVDITAVFETSCEALLRRRLRELRIKNFS
ncbi:MAG: tetraacyldisaccharide 4'-kinase [Pseudomonadota bacterium]